MSLPKTLTGAPGELLPITAESGAPLISWRPTPGLRVVNDDPVDATGKSKLLHAAKPGVYFVFAAIPDDKGGVRSAVCEVTIGGKVDPPPVDPVIPTDPVAFLVIIEETGQAVANRGAMFADPKLAARLREKSIGWRTADQDVKDARGNAPADLVPYLNKAKGRPLPQVFLIAANGKLIHQGDLPGDVAGLLALLARHGG